MGLEAVPFCDFIEECERNNEHVHNWAHKICSQIVPDCRRLARMGSDSTLWLFLLASLSSIDSDFGQPGLDFFSADVYHVGDA